MGKIANMNETDRAHFIDLIRKRLVEIDAEDTLGSDGQSTVVLDQQAVGRLSRMDALQSQAMALAHQKRRDAEKARLHRALERIGDDDYGYCEECGDDISHRRLELNLTAARCVECVAG